MTGAKGTTAPATTAPPMTKPKPLDAIDLFDGTCVSCGGPSHNGTCLSAAYPAAR